MLLGLHYKLQVMELVSLLISHRPVTPDKAVTE